MPVYVDESGGLHAGAMIMAGVEIASDAASALLARFRAVTRLRGELKGSRISLIERAFFYELLERFGGRARVCILADDTHRVGPRPEDFDVYVALLNQLVDEWVADSNDCMSVTIDAGRYDAMVLEKVRQDVARLLTSCGSAKMIESHRSPGVQIADVIANSFYNIEVRSGRSVSIGVIVDPFVAAGLIQTSLLRKLPLPKQKHPTLQGNAGRSAS